MPAPSSADDANAPLEGEPPTVENAWRALHLLKTTLETKEMNGQNQVWLSEDARVVLRRFLKAKVTAQPGPVAERAAAMREAAMDARPVEGESSLKDELLRLTAADGAPKAAAPLADFQNVPKLDPEAREARLAEIRARAEVSPEARALGTLREHMVFAVGNPSAELVFVGEAPGAQEEIEGEPFVGPAGELLNKMITAMGLDRSKVYISNVCKFRPGMPGQTSDNRKPTTEEMQSCLPYLMQELEIIQPRIIVALGGTAAEGLLGLTGKPVSRMRAEKHELRGIPVVVTYHPSYLLRNQSVSEKRKVWEDLLGVMETLGMPISERQRGFFLPKAS